MQGVLQQMSVKGLIQQWDISSGLVLTDPESKELLREAGIPAVETKPVTTADEAVSAASASDFPVLLRPVSRQRLLLDGRADAPLSSEADVRRAFPVLLAQAKSWDAGVEALSVSKAPPPGVEVIVRLHHDLLFGPVLSFGYGKMAVEVWEDVAYRIVPLTGKDARLMIREPKGSRLLQGYEALPAPGASHLEELLLKVSGLVHENRQIEKLELFPVYAYREQVLVAEARIELKGREEA